MFVDGRTTLNNLLSRIADSLDIPDHIYEDATLKYEDVSAWLGAEDSGLGNFSPEIYPQGSFRLGTAIRPISESEKYDIDLVCRLSLTKEQTSKDNLKQLVADRLKQRTDLATILEVRDRCLRLNYASKGSAPHFHMDVLPSIPNPERLPAGILIAYKESNLWQKSNPQAYGEWFISQMKTVFAERKALKAKSLDETIEDVPDWQVKTPLQMVIQIVKRHRDVFFQNDRENKPVSIILTTLAAHAYNNQPNIYEALLSVLQDMPRKIEERNGKWWVANPVDPDENFADKWNEHPERRVAFERWFKKIQSDFSRIDESGSPNEVTTLLVTALGQQPITKATSDIGLQLSSPLPVSIRPQAVVPELGNAQHCQSPLWPMQLRYKADVKGSVHNKFRKKLWVLTNSVPKNVELKFKLTTNSPLPYEVKWQIVNTGKEAVEANNLRGDFYDSEEKHPDVHWESTLYNGTHWVEAFVIRNGVCVARSGRKLVKVR